MEARPVSLLPFCAEVLIPCRGTGGKNHKSKHIASPTPFLFLPVGLSQSLAQV